MFNWYHRYTLYKYCKSGISQRNKRKFVKENPLKTKCLYTRVRPSSLECTKVRAPKYRHLSSSASEVMIVVLKIYLSGPRLGKNTGEGFAISSIFSRIPYPIRSAISLKMFISPNNFLRFSYFPFHTNLQDMTI